MPRIDARISVRVKNKRDIAALANSVAQIVRATTGSTCQVITTVSDAPGSINRINVKRAVNRANRRGHIELRP